MRNSSRPFVLTLLLASGVLASAHPAAAQEQLETADPVTAVEDPGAPTLALPPPSWYTEKLHRQILAAGPRGIDVPLPSAEERATELNCLGYSPPYVATDDVSVGAVSAGGCMVFPAGCSMNFVFTDGIALYIGTAGHCVTGGGTVVMQVATRIDPTGTVEPVATLAAIGKVAKRVNQGIGRDFAIVKVDSAFNVVPGVAGALGPTGVFCGDPLGQPVLHYGHGYVFAVEQGIAKTGEVIPDLGLVFNFTSESTGYNWVGYGLPGDSGSGVMDAAGLVVGDLTHGIGLAGVPIPGLNFGTTTAGMFGIIGGGYSLVTVDGRPVRCSGLPVGL
ncbi:MAG TPA: hypothetical protein VNJ70_14675 [Thermoanaerobaculia bacterium]|nr:hypothetical protein [Thermoanaerobaculia bacterium]